MNSCESGVCDGRASDGCRYVLPKHEAVRAAEQNWNRCAWRSRYNHARTGSDRSGGACDDFVRAVLQITPIRLAATVSSLINGGTRITPHLATVLRKDGRFGAHFGAEGNGAKTDSFGRNERPAAQHPVSGRGKRRRKKWKSRRLSGGRQDGDQRDASSRYWSVYFFVSGFCTCGRSEGAGRCALSETPKASIMADWWRRR